MALRLAVIALLLAPIARAGGFLVEGTVLDPDDRPIAGATVESEDGGSRALTGPTGAFRIELSSPGLARLLVASAPGHVAHAVLPRRGQPARVVLERAATLRGVVRGPGAPGARVIASNLDTMCCCVQHTYSVRCDELGAFLLEGLPEARYVVEAVSDEGRSTQQALLASAFRAPAPLELTLVEGRPPPPTDWRGRPLVDALGQAPPRARAPAELPPGRLDLSGLGEDVARWTTASTDGRGYGSADRALPLGRVHVVAVGSEDRAAAGWFEVRADAPTMVDLQLAPAARVRGRLVDPLGRAARLWLDLAGSGSTGPDGRFERVLPPGRWTLWVADGRGLELVAARFGSVRASLERVVDVPGPGDVDLGDIVVQVE